MVDRCFGELLLWQPTHRRQVVGAARGYARTAVPRMYSSSFVGRGANAALAWALRWWWRHLPFPNPRWWLATRCSTSCCWPTTHNISRPRQEQRRRRSRRQPFMRQWRNEPVRMRAEGHATFNSASARGPPPLTVAFCCPPTKKMKWGKPRTPNRRVVRGHSWFITLQNTAPRYSFASAS